MRTVMFGRTTDFSKTSTWNRKHRVCLGLAIQEEDIAPPAVPVTKWISRTMDGSYSKGIRIMPIRKLSKREKKPYLNGGVVIRVPRENIPDLIEELKKFV